MDFNHVATTFEQLETVSSRIDMTKELAQLFAQATPSEISIICNFSLGLLRAPYKGNQFNLAQKSMIAIVAAILDMHESVVKKHMQEMGDLGSIVAHYGSWQTSEHMSVVHIYKELSALEQISGTGSQEDKSAILQKLLVAVTPLSAKFIIRIILGTLRLGFSDMTLIDALSWMAVGNKSLRTILEDAYNRCADIGLIAQTLKEEGIEGLEHMKIVVGVPIRPAAAERLPSPKAIIEKIGHCIAQPKLDGFRLQIHIDKRHAQPKVEFFSRNLLDMSYMFPDLLEPILSIDVEDMICEGEAIAYDPHTGTFLPFQETVKRKRKHGIEQAITDFPLRVYLFDLLYVNGVDYMSKTHEDRRKKLLKLVSGSKNEAVQVIEERPIASAEQLEEYFLENIAHGLEGLVVKKQDSIYQPGKRNFNWIKLKRHEEGELEDTIDCVVLGYYAGAGKRASFGIGAFLVGIYNKNHDTFQTIAKIGTGLKDEGWIELKKRCDMIKVAEKPKNVECAKELYPDVWVSPSLIVVIRADEITMSPLHTSGKTPEKLGFALRFPRFIDYRIDKSMYDTTTVTEVKRLYEDQFIKAKK
jgi:DNA ligase-1